MMAMVEEKGSANGEEDYTQDGTVDLKGRPVLRSKTGRWKACSFIVGKSKMMHFAALTTFLITPILSLFSFNCFHIQYNVLSLLMNIGYTFLSFIAYEVFERMAFYGIASNLVVYLTEKLHEGTVESSNNISNLSGAVWMMPLAGAYIADAYLGRYRTFVIASGIYFLV